MNATLRSRAGAYGRTTKVVSCENCQRRYAYELDRVGHNAEHLERLLAEGVEAIPCPACGWYQSGMLPEARKRHCRWMLYLGQCLTVGLVPVAVFGISLNVHNDSPPIPWVVLVAGLVCLFAAGIGMFVWRRRRFEDFNPNDADVEARRRYGRSRAVLVPETSPQGITADVGPDVRFSCGPNRTGITGRAGPAAPAGDLPVTASKPPAAPAKNPQGGAGGAASEQEVLKTILGGIAGILLIIGCVCYWKAESEREAKKDVERWQRSMKRADERMRQEPWRLPPPQPPPGPPLPQR
jgi:hypothetical protein